MTRPMSMARSLAAVCAVLLAVMAASPAEAQWKWKDKSGHTQYSDLPPPPGTPDADILGRPSAGRRGAAPVVAASAPASAASGAPKLALKSADPELEAKRKQAEADAATKTKAEEARVAAARADNCNRARGQIKTLDSGIRLARTNDKGEREVLDDKQRADEMKRAQDAVSTDCK